MRYGFTQDLTTIVGAADSVVEVELWYEQIKDTNLNFSTSRISTFLDQMQSQELKGYKHPAYIFTHDSEKEQNAFILTQAITILPYMSVKDYHDDMIAVKDSEAGYTQSELDDNRSLEDIYSLEENDKWDKRSDAEKEAEKENKKKLDKLKQRIGDSVTGNSFDPNPHGNSKTKGGISVDNVSVGGAGDIKVKATKHGNKSTEQSTSDVNVDFNFDIDGLTNEQVFDKLEKKVNASGFSDEQIEQWRKNVQEKSKEDDFDLNALVQSVLVACLDKQITDALEPVTGVSDQNAAIDTIKNRLEQIPDLTPEIRNNILQEAVESINAPKPQPADFKFALNQKLTDSKVMRGVGTPILHIKTNKDGPNQGAFTPTNSQIYLETFGLEVVSENIFAYEVNKDDPAYVVDIRQHLVDEGFIEDANVIPQPLQPKMGQNNNLTPNDVAKALAGDGTSAVEGTGSFGRIKVGKSEEDYMDDLKPGINNKAATQNQDALLAPTALTNLPNELQKMLQDALGDVPDTVFYGDYSGVQFGGEQIGIMSLGANDKLIDAACYNVKHLGGVKVNDGSSSFAFTKEYKTYVGIITVQGLHELKVYKI